MHLYISISVLQGICRKMDLALGCANLLQSHDVTAALSFSLLCSKSVSCLQGMNLEFQPVFPGFFQLVQTLWINPLEMPMPFTTSSPWKCANALHMWCWVIPVTHIFSSKIWLRPQYRLHLVELVAILTCYVLWWKCRNLKEELTHSKCKWWTPPGLVMHFVLAFWSSLERTYQSWRQEHMPLFFVVASLEISWFSCYAGVHQISYPMVWVLEMAREQHMLAEHNRYSIKRNV